MHFLDFFSIIERDLSILNPTSHDKLMQLADDCEVRDGSKVLDVASGKGYLLRQWARRWDVEATGVELNPTFVKEARERAEAEGVTDRVRFVQGDAKALEVEAASYDVVTCLGAPFALGGFDEAVRWMLHALKPDGVLALGDEFLPAPLPDDVAKREGVEPGDYRTLVETVGVLETHALTPTGFIAGSQDDYDAYTSGAWRTAYAWAQENPEHPERDEVLQKVAEGREQYLRFIRPYLGWGIFVARRRL